MNLHKPATFLHLHRHSERKPPASLAWTETLYSSLVSSELLSFSPSLPRPRHGPHGQREAQSARSHSPLPPGPLPAPPAPGVLNAQQQDSPAGQILELSQIRHDESMKLAQLPGPWGRNSRKVHTERTQARLLARDTAAIRTAQEPGRAADVHTAQALCPDHGGQVNRGVTWSSEAPAGAPGF